MITLQLSDFLYLGQKCAIVATEQIWYNPKVSGIQRVVPVKITMPQKETIIAMVIIWEGCTLTIEEIMKDFESLNAGCSVRQIKVD
mgnify:CR=1 FL=1